MIVMNVWHNEKTMKYEINSCIINSLRYLCHSYVDHAAAARLFMSESLGLPSIFLFYFSMPTNELLASQVGALLMGKWNWLNPWVILNFEYFVVYMYMLYAILNFLFLGQQTCPVSDAISKCLC
ncbi:hypothetical protein ACJX0J_009419 [Zea mays]